MQLTVSLLALGAMALGIKIYAHGYCNSVEGVALWLKRHAKGVREMHSHKHREINQRWVRELESTPMSVEDLRGLPTFAQGKSALVVGIRGKEVE